MNPISPQIKIGAVGELLVQLRLLQFGVQAAPPLKDSGNDLIAVRGEVVRAFQIKTTTTHNDYCSFDKRGLPELYHVLAIVKLDGEGDQLYLDSSEIYLLRKQEVLKGRYWFKEIQDKLMSPELLNNLFLEKPPGIPAAR